MVLEISYPIKVGCLSDQKDPKTNKRKILSYCMIKTDTEGWVDAKEYLPVNFDLVHMKVGTKVLSGWIAGNKWDGLRLLPNMKVEYWRRRFGQEEEMTGGLEWST